MSYPAIPVAEGGQPRKNHDSWAYENDLAEIIDSSPFLKLQDEDVLTALVGSKDFEAFKLLVAANGNVTDHEVDLLTMFVIGDTASSTSSGQLTSTVNLATETKVLQTSLKLKRDLGPQGEGALKLVVAVDRISKLGNYGVVCTLVPTACFAYK